MSRSIGALSLVALSIFLSACATPEHTIPRIPAVEYADRVKGEMGMRPHDMPSARLVSHDPHERASLRLAPAADLSEGEAEGSEGSANAIGDSGANDTVTNLGSDGEIKSAFEERGITVHESTQPHIRDYNGPLSLGDPGLSASLWKESRGGNALFRDYRAWQPMDLITIVVSEASEGKKEADTTVTQESTVQAAIENLFGLESTATKKNPQVALDNLINATASHDYKGEGETTRKGSLKARLSAMVAEVLPSGILRIEGEKIISVNNEDEVMVISGLVRPEDVSSSNEVDSSKVANVRIDYFGKGTVGDVQNGGWLGRILRRLWPL